VTFFFGDGTTTPLLELLLTERPWR
jgi:hypothetical protein